MSTRQMTGPAELAGLHASSVEQLWITDSYGFLVAGFVITMGTLGDRVGRRRLLLIGAAAFAAVSVTGTVDGRNFVFLPGRLLPFAGSGRPGFSWRQRGPGHGAMPRPGP